MVLEGHNLKRVHELKKGRMVRRWKCGGQERDKGEGERDQRVMEGVTVTREMADIQSKRKAQAIKEKRARRS